MANGNIDDFSALENQLGRIDGIKAFREMMDAASKPGRHRDMRIASAIHEAGKVCAAGGAVGNRKLSAAVSFVSLASELLAMRAVQGNYAEWLDDELESANLGLTIMKELDAKVDARRHRKTIEVNSEQSLCASNDPAVQSLIKRASRKTPIRGK